MDANVGDEIVVDGLKAGDPSREGQILEVLRTGGVVHYRVRWDDNGHEVIFYSGSTTHVLRVAKH